MYAVGDAHVNPSEITEDGAYLFERVGQPGWPRRRCPAKAIGATSSRTARCCTPPRPEESIVVPSDAAVLTLVGDAAADEIRSGDSAELILYELPELPDAYVKFGGELCAVDSVNAPAPGGAALYTPGSIHFFV